MGLASFTYKTIFRRSPTMLLAGVVGAVFYEGFADWFSMRVYHNINQGKLWDDIKHKYENNSEAV